MRKWLTIKNKRRVFLEYTFSINVLRSMKEIVVNFLIMTFRTLS